MKWRRSLGGIPILPDRLSFVGGEAGNIMLMVSYSSDGSEAGNFADCENIRPPPLFRPLARLRPKLAAPCSICDSRTMSMGL